MYQGCTDADGKKWPGGLCEVIRMYKKAGTVAINFFVWPSEYVKMNDGKTPKKMVVPISSVEMC